MQGRDNIAVGDVECHAPANDGPFQSPCGRVPRVRVAVDDKDVFPLVLKHCE